MTRAQFAKQARRAMQKLGVSGAQVILTEAEEGVVFDWRGIEGDRARITTEVMDGPEMSIARERVLRELRGFAERRERAA